MKELVSIITPNYNGAKYINLAINSVIAQTYTNWELIIIDDCSTDQSINIILEYISFDSRIRLIQNKINQGPAFSRNKGIKAAKGRFITFLDSDDLWYPNKLSVQVKFILDNNFALIYSSYDKINSAGEKIGDFSAPVKVSYQDTLKSCSIGCLTVMYDTKHLGKKYFSIYSPKAKEDFILWLKILKTVEFAYGINIRLAQYRVHDKSISNDKLKMAKEQWKVYREHEKIGLIKSMYFFINYFIKGIIKTLK